MGSQSLIVELGAGGHHTVYSKIVLEGGYDGHFLVSAETWQSLPKSTRDSHVAQVHIVPGVAWERKRQVELIFEFLRENPGVTRCFILSYAEVLFPLLRRKFVVRGKTGHTVPISGLWNVDNLFESRETSPSGGGCAG